MKNKCKTWRFSLEMRNKNLRTKYNYLKADYLINPKIAFKNKNLTAFRRKNKN